MRQLVTIMSFGKLFYRTPRSRSVTIGGATEIDSAAEEIERKSALIQREMERERRARSVSPSPVVTSHNALTSLSSSLPPRPSTSRAITSSKIQVRHKPFRGNRGLMVRRLLGMREVLGSNPLGTKTLCWFLLCSQSSHFLSSKLLSNNYVIRLSLSEAELLSRDL